MNRGMLERLAPLSGAIAVVLVVVSALVLNFWSYLPSGTELQAYYTDNSSRIFVGAYIGLLGGAALLWFAGSLREVVRDAEGGGGRLAALAFGGTIASGALLEVSYSIVAAAGARGGATLGITEAAATTLYDIYGTVVGSGAAACLAVALLAVGLASLRHGLFRPWIGWVTILLAIGSVTPISYVFAGIDMVWILVVSIGLFAANRPAPAMA